MASPAPEPPRFVVCARPAGCGWWWEYHDRRPHWWAWRRRRWYFGPFFEDGGTGWPRWRLEDEMQEHYADCWAHLVTTSRRPA